MGQSIMTALQHNICPKCGHDLIMITEADSTSFCLDCHHMFQIIEGRVETIQFLGLKGAQVHLEGDTSLHFKRR